jgi:hypothetical protein
VVSGTCLASPAVDPPPTDGVVGGDLCDLFDYVLLRLNSLIRSGQSLNKHAALHHRFSPRDLTCIHRSSYTLYAYTRAH